MPRLRQASQMVWSREAQHLTPVLDTFLVSSHPRASAVCGAVQPVMSKEALTLVIWPAGVASEVPTHFPAFPFDPPYPIQQHFMAAVYRRLQTGGVGLFESPTGALGGCSW